MPPSPYEDCDFDEQTLRDLVTAHKTLPPPPQRRRIRENAGISLAELADVLGVSVQQMTAMERAPHPAHLLGYSRALRIMAPFSDVEIREIREAFKKNEGCRHCGGLHAVPVTACPRLRRAREEGNHWEVVYRDAWDTSETIFPWQLPKLTGESDAA